MPSFLHSDHDSGGGIQTFENHVRSTAQHIRAVLVEVMDSVNADATRPQAVAKQLGMDKSLSWKLSKIINEDDLFKVVAHLPGRAGMTIAMKSFQKAGASRESIQALQQAIADFDHMVQVHCGDRETLELMLGHLQRDGNGTHEESLRKKSFQGNSAIWGVQARVRFSAHFMAPARTSPDLLDVAVVSGLIDFRRLRSQTPWAVASVRQYSDDGSPVKVDPYEPIDPAVGRNEAPLIHEFCSNPPPTLRVTAGLPGVTRYEIVEGPVGKTAACTCVTGWISRAELARHRTEHDQYGEHLASLNTPAELSFHDFFVHVEMANEVRPTVHLYSQLPGGPVYPQCGRGHGELPLRESLIELGASPPDLVTSEAPQYPKLVALAVSRLGGTLNDYIGYRIKLRYPPIPTVLLFRHELAKRS